jgi:protein-S-isoprenylcysteine O-methyltransferase Ste14
MVTIFILKRITKERGKDNFLNPTYIVLFFVEFTSYLIWGSYDFTTSQGMAKITAILSGGESTVPALVSKVGPLITPNGIYYAVILFLSLIGIGYIFYQKNDKSTKNLLYLAIACFIFLIAYIPGPLDFIPKASSLLLWRIPLLVSPVIAFCAALGIKSILIWPGTAERINPPKYKVVAVVLILVVITTFFSTLADSNAHDSLELNTLPKDSSYFSGVELVALSFMYDYVDKNVPIYSDYPTIRNNIYDQNQFETANIISNGNISYIDYGYLILRAGQLEDRNCLLFSTSEGECSSFVYRLDENDPA